MKHLKFLKVLILGIALSVSGLSSVKASHIMGGNITYECLGNNQYAVSLTMFFDCGTYNINTSGFAQSLQITNDCGLANPTASLPYNSALSNIEVSQLCPSQLPNSECASPPGTQPGVWQATWTGTITLPAGCNSWHFWYSTCCWNSNTNTPGTPGQLYHTSLNNLTAPCDASPFLAGQQIPYLCANQINTYSVGANDPDGNTLVYSLVPAQQGSAGSPGTVPYNAGYTGAAPIPGITIDPNTGLITVNPGVTGNFIIQVDIASYDANGNLIGVVSQQFQIVVVVCTNQVPTPAPTLSNITGNVVQTGPTSLQVCEGNNFCFDFTITDPDPTVTMTVTSNASTIFPGATVTVTGNNPWNVNVCGLAGSGSGGSHNILFNIQDDACPIPGMANLLVTMDVIIATYAGPNDTVCVGQGAQLQATGGSVFTWTVASGSPINVPANFSCNPCDDPIATPAVTTTYVVTSNLTGGCDNVDTVTVFVVPAFTYTVTQSSTSSCLQQPVNITVTPNPAGAYTYAWSPASANFGPTNSATPVFTPTAPGLYTFHLDVGSAAGCHYDDSVSISVAAAYSPNITVSASLDSVGCGEWTQLQIDLGGGIPAVCGTSLAGCTGPTSALQPGPITGSNTTTSYPAIWGNFYKSGRTQMLFTSAELNAMGFIGGKITEIGVPVTSISGTTTYKNVSISIGCTGITQFGSGWETGLTNVFGPQNVNIAVGPNTIPLTSFYEWDGISNLIVEFCSDNTADPSWTLNSVSPRSTTPALQCQYVNVDWQAACPNNTAPAWGSPTTLRPAIVFTTCPADPDTTAYTYQWTGAPVNGVFTNPNGMTTMAQPIGNTYYTALVTYTAGGCTDTAGVFVEACGCFPADPILTNVSCNGGNDGSITANMVGTTGPFTVIWTDSLGATLQTSNNVVATDVLNTLAAGTYTITTIDTSGCSKDTTVTLTEPPIITLTAVADDTICLTENFVLSAVAAGGNGGPYTLTWDNALAGNGPHSVSPATTTTYIVNATDALGCSADDDSVLLFVHPPLAALTSGSINLCIGNTVTVSAGASGGMGAPYTFNWFQGVNQIGTGSVISVSPLNNNTQYCVVVNDGCNTPSDSACLIASFFPQPQPSFVGDTVAGCYPVNTTFMVTTNPAMVSSADWVFGDGGTANGAPTVTYSYGIPNQDCYDVTLTITSPDGCIDDTTIVDYVCVYDYPDPSFAWAPQPVDIFNPFVQFTDASSPDAITFDWTIYDTSGVNVLTTSNLQNPSYVFPNNEGGSYPVMLVVSNANGCIDTITYTVIINDIFTLYVPNAFTPDANGTNDIFLPRGESISADDYDLKVFDRWGNVVFHSTDFTKGWDGTNNNIKSKSDTYVWKLKVKSTVDNKKYERYGHVLLLR